VSRIVHVIETLRFTIRPVLRWNRPVAIGYRSPSSIISVRRRRSSLATPTTTNHPRNDEETLRRFSFGGGGDVRYFADRSLDGGP